MTTSGNDWRTDVKGSDYGYDVNEDTLRTADINPTGGAHPQHPPSGGGQGGAAIGGIPLSNPFGNGMPTIPKMDKDFLERILSLRHSPLFIAKSFYFFFFASFGSLFPLLGVYFKQLGMNPAQCGILIGIRPFVELCSAPMWGGVADRFKKGKILLLFSIVCWISFTIGLAYIQPPANSCVMLNGTDLILVDPWAVNDPALVELEDAPPKYQDVGRSPIPIEAKDFANIPEEGGPLDLVSPTLTNIVYKTREIHGVFLILLILMIIAEFFSAPALTLADSATLGSLESAGGGSENYGAQRMFGSIGWGVAMFIVGIALDTSNTIHDHPCGHSQVGEKNYTTCFIMFSVMMVFAFIAATQFRFSYNGQQETELGDLKNKVFRAFGTLTNQNGLKTEQDVKTNMDGQYQNTDTGQSYQQGDNINTRENTSNAAAGDRRTSLERQLNINLYTSDETRGADTVQQPVHSTFIPRGKPGQSGTVPNMKAVMSHLLNIHYISLLLVTWLMGFGIGIVFTFLFWHLQDLNGSPTLFGMASVVNHISELGAYFFSDRLITTVGHIRVIYIGLFGNMCRFLYISWIRSPWAVLPFEFIQGLTHAAVFAACCSYVTQSLPGELRSSAQMIMQSVHHGLGRGCGAVLGGIIVYASGSERAFRGYGITCLVVLLLYGAMNYLLARRGDPGPLAAVQDPHMHGQQQQQQQQQPHAHQQNEAMHFAPHGVPTGGGLGQTFQGSDDGESFGGQPPVGAIYNYDQ